MFNIYPAPDVVENYNTLYKQLSGSSFEDMTQTDVYQKLMILKKNCAIVIQTLLPEYFDAFTQGIPRLNELVVKYNRIYENQPIELFQLPPKPQSFVPILPPLKVMSSISDLGLSENWENTALKVGWIVMGVTLNVLGFTAGRYGLQAASTFLQTPVWSVAEIITSNAVEDALKAAALGSVNGAAFLAPLVENRVLAIESVDEEPLQRRSLVEQENTTCESDWETVQSSIQISLSCAAEKFESNGDPISACLFDDLYVLMHLRSLVTETYDSCDSLAIIQTLEYLAYYFIGVYPDSRGILYDIVQQMTAISSNANYSARFQQVLFLSKPASIAQRSCAHILNCTAPGYSLIDWSRLQKLRLALPKEVLEKLVEVRQYNQYAITQLRAVRYAQYRQYLTKICSISDTKPEKLEEKLESKTDGIEWTISSLLQRFSSLLKYPTDTINGKDVSKNAKMGFPTWW